MLKSISKLGVILSKLEQKSISGGELGTSNRCQTNSDCLNAKYCCDSRGICVITSILVERCYSNQEDDPVS